jgi:hypothetical protein
MTSLERFMAFHKTKSSPTTIKKENVFTFGKYKGRGYDEIFNMDKSYIAYVMGAETKFWQRAQLYFLQKIEKEDELKN